MDERLIIEVNRGEYLRELVVSVLLAAIAVFLCFFRIDFFAQYQFLNWIIRIICVAAAIVFTYRTIMFIIKILSSKPLLIVDENGVTDNTTPLSLGFVEWADVRGIYLEGQVGTHTIEIDIENEEKYISKLSQRKQAVLYNGVYSDCATISIDLGLTEEDCQDLVGRMQQIFDEYKKEKK